MVSFWCCLDRIHSNILSSSFVYLCRWFSTLVFRYSHPDIPVFPFYVLFNITLDPAHLVVLFNVIGIYYSKYMFVCIFWVKVILKIVERKWENGSKWTFICFQHTHTHIHIGVLGHFVLDYIIALAILKAQWWREQRWRNGITKRERNKNSWKEKKNKSLFVT